MHGCYNCIKAIANVMGDLKIKGSGVFYDTDKFKAQDGTIRQFFGPYAYRYREDDDGEEVSCAIFDFKEV